MVSTFSLSTRYRLYAEREKITATKNKTAKIPVVMFDLKIFIACTPVVTTQVDRLKTEDC